MFENILISNLCWFFRRKHIGIINPNKQILLLVSPLHSIVHFSNIQCWFVHSFSWENVPISISSSLQSISICIAFYRQGLYGCLKRIFVNFHLFCSKLHQNVMVHTFDCCSQSWFTSSKIAFKFNALRNVDTLHIRMILSFCK